MPIEYRVELHQMYQYYNYLVCTYRHMGQLLNLGVTLIITDICNSRNHSEILVMFKHIVGLIMEPIFWIVLVLDTMLKIYIFINDHNSFVTYMLVAIVKLK